MTPLHITVHAIERWLERVDPRATWNDARAALNSPTIARAAEFGAPYVRLGTGQRVVLEGHSVVTVLPVGTPAWRLGCPHRSDGPNDFTSSRDNI